MVQDTTIFENNQSTLCLVSAKQAHGRSKHIDIKHHFIRDFIMYGRIKLTYRVSSDNVAHMLTKALPVQQFENLKECVVSVTTVFLISEE